MSTTGAMKTWNITTSRGRGWANIRVLIELLITEHSQETMEIGQKHGRQDQKRDLRSSLAYSTPQRTGNGEHIISKLMPRGINFEIICSPLPVRCGVEYASDDRRSLF